MKNYDELQNFIDYMVKVRASEGKEVQADLMHSEHHYGYRFRLFRPKTKHLLVIEISYDDVYNKKAFDIILNAFNTQPFNKPSKLEKALA